MRANSPITAIRLVGASGRIAPVVLEQDHRLRGGGPGQRWWASASKSSSSSRTSMPLSTSSRTVRARASRTCSSSSPARTAATTWSGLRGRFGGISRSRPGLQRGDAVVDRAPVRHHEPLEPELLTQHRREQPRVLRRRQPVDLVVRAHDRPRLAGRDDPLERREVDLPQRPLVDLRIDPQPVGLLVVGRVVLDRGADPAATGCRRRSRPPAPRPGTGPRRSTRSCARTAATASC